MTPSSDHTRTVRGQYTTHAQAEGAIDGTFKDYIVDSAFATQFRYSIFDTDVTHRLAMRSEVSVDVRRVQRWSRSDVSLR